MKRNLEGKRIKKAVYGATGKKYNYRVDVDANNWSHFSDEKTAKKYAEKTGGIVRYWSEELQKYVTIPEDE